MSPRSRCRSPGAANGAIASPKRTRPTPRSAAWGSIRKCRRAGRAMPGRKRSAGGSRASCASSNDACDRLLPIAANCGYGRASFEFEPIRGLMAKEELLEMRGQVVELLPNAMFRVKLENDHEILGHTADRKSKRLNSRHKCTP